jgi:hypothetical protein
MGQLDNFEPWRFGPIRLAVETGSVRLTMRRHEHVYPHTAGAAGEKMGRGLYVIHCAGRFDDGLAANKDYENHLTQMGVFRALVEEETTEDLTIPWIGKVQAQCTEFELTERSTIRSGLAFTASFVEDMNHEFPIQNFIKVNRAPMMNSAINFSNHKWEADIFSKIAAGVGKVLGIKDQYELYSALVQSKISYLESLFREADSTANELKDPKNILGLELFFALWESVRNFANDIASKGLEFRWYTVPVQMSLQEVAIAVFGSASKAGDLLGLNPIEDSLAIPAGTKIRYYEQA